MKSLLSWITFVAAIHLSWSAAIEPKAISNQKSMVCYYGSWAVYRPRNGKFDVENIDPYLCTHIIYGFNGLGMDSTMIPLDPYNDLYDNYGKGAFLRFTGLKAKNPNLKAIIAIGGWNEGSEKYSRMVSDPARRAKFVTSVVNFLIKYNFDGLDFDWEYPANRGGASTDKVNYISMIRELKAAFAPYGFLLTAAVSPGKSTIDTAYDIPAMGEILDQIHVMSYDLHGTWEPYTGLNAPLFANPKYDIGPENQLLNVNWTINYWLSSGVPRSKILLGIPLYGHGYTLSNPSINGFYASAPQAIAAGPYTQQAGTWGYNEICERFASDPGWTVVRDECYQTPYAYKNNLWIGYDDEQSIRLKGQYIAAMDLGGALTWSIETDDFRGLCSGTPFLLTKTVVNAMNGPTNLMPSNPCLNSASGGTTVTPSANPVITSTTPASLSTSTTLSTTTANNVSTISTVNNVSTTTPPTPTSTTGTSSVCKKSGLNPDPTDCGIFYQCVSNGNNGWMIYTQRCAPGTVFNPNINGCDYATNVPGC